eukprot:1298890-Prymnesium_polylepis.1
MARATRIWHALPSYGASQAFPPRVVTRTYYVETIVRPELKHYAKNTTPADFKFLVFGEEIASVGVLEGRKTKH